MDNGHTDNDNFEQSFLNSVDQAVGVPMQPVASVTSEPVTPRQPKMATPQMQPAMTQPIVSSPAMADNETEPARKLPIFLIATIVCAVIVVVLLVVMFVMGKKPSIASDPTENVKLNDAGNVEAIGVYCRLDDGIMYLELSNSYFIEPSNISSTLIELEDGSYEQLEVDMESGHYTVDGTSLHFVSDDGGDYRATYSSHELKLKNKTYQCTNYE